MSYRREITTLGRGGSDTTAVALAAALEAERCEIYSDVDGVYSADPRAVPDARHLPELSHEMLQEMAECGAKVVCAQAVEWARRAGIAVYARSTFDPVAREGAPVRQTIVRRTVPDERLGARAVVAGGEAALGRIDDGAQLFALLRAAEEAKVSLTDVSVGPRGGALVIPLLNVPDWAGARRHLLAAVPGLDLAEGVTVVSVVGDGLAATPEPLVRFLGALRGAGIAERQVTATPLRLGAVIDAARAAEAQRVLHAAFAAHVAHGRGFAGS